MTDILLFHYSKHLPSEGEATAVLRSDGLSLCILRNSQMISGDEQSLPWF